MAHHYVVNALEIKIFLAVVLKFKKMIREITNITALTSSKNSEPLVLRKSFKLQFLIIAT